MKQIKTVALALGLLSGGVAIGQMLSTTPIQSAQSKTKTDYAAEATTIINNYTAKASGLSGPTSANLANEAAAQLLYIQAKQNAEIIRLLTEIKNKK